nr:hypothetical protein [uncultured Dyadobacter sp.]
MKKIIAIGVITGIVVFVFMSSCARRMEARRNQENPDVARKNKTEGYFYYQPQQPSNVDSSALKKDN